MFVTELTSFEKSSIEGSDAPKWQWNLNKSNLYHVFVTFIHRLCVCSSIRISIGDNGAVDDTRFLGRDASGNAALNAYSSLAGLASSLAV